MNGVLVRKYTIIRLDGHSYLADLIIGIGEVTEVSVRDHAVLENPLLDNHAGRVEHLKFDVPLVASGITLTTGDGFGVKPNPFHDRLG